MKTIAIANEPPYRGVTFNRQSKNGRHKSGVAGVDIMHEGASVFLERKQQILAEHL